MNWTKLRNLQFRGFQFVPLLLVLACFAAGSLLLASAIASPRIVRPQHITKHIEDVKIGDWVLAKDPNENGPAKPHRVVGLPRNWTDHVVHIQVAGGELQATRNHPFYVQGKGWVEARDLKVRDRLPSDHGQYYSIEKLWTEDRSTNTFNLTIEGVHTYYVLAGEARILVHNQDIPPIIYRLGGTNPGNFKVRPGEKGVSFTDSLANPWPLKEGQRAVYPNGQNDYVSIDSSKLPSGSVDPDGVPPGHVTVTGVSPEELKDAATKGNFQRDFGAPCGG